MPVQKHGSRPVERPAGMIAPQVDVAGVTELRLHGVGGTTPENLLVDAAPQLVSGNRIAGFYRTVDRPAAGARGIDGDRAGGDPAGGTHRQRHVEAYSWGGLTSRSASRVLWLLLFPFALANVAGWMCAPELWRARRRFYLYRWLVRLAALGMTVNLLLLAAMTTMDLVGYQCGAQSACVDRWWLRWLRTGPLVDHPGLRVLLGAGLPLLVIVILAVLAGRSLNRYEQVDPPRNVDDPDLQKPPGAAPTPARPGIGLSDKNFWNGKRSVTHLAVVHIGAGLAFIGWLLGRTAPAIPTAGAAADGLEVAAIVLAVAGLALAVALLGRDSIPPVSAWSVVALGLLAVLAAAVFTLVQPAAAGAAADAPPGPLPGMRAAINWTYVGCIIPVVGVLVANWLGGRPAGPFLAAGPFSAITLGVVLLNGVGIGLMIRIADLLGNVPNPGVGRGPRPTPLVVFDAVYAVTPFLTLLPTALVLLFAIYQGVRVWHAARPAECARILAEYRDAAEPAEVTGWVRSSTQDEARRRARLAEAGPLTRLWHWLRRPGWAASIARGRRLATVPHDVDKLLTGMAFVALVVLAVFWGWFLAKNDVPRLTPWLLTTSTWLAAALPIGVLILLRQGWRSLDSRRHIGVVWDVGTFWPRAYHPLAPPSYAERAVPDLQRRLWYLREHRGVAVLAAHSQGSVIAAAALLQKDCRPPDDHVGLVTFGSPLSKLYGWAFPAYFGPSVLARLRAGVWRWRNYYYLSDPIGGPLAAQDRLASCDVRLLDPAAPWYVYGQDPPALGRHSGYWADQRVWDRVDRDANKIPVPTTPLPPDAQLAPTAQPEP
jgi:hypothetical protein